MGATWHNGLILQHEVDKVTDRHIQTNDIVSNIISTTGVECVW